MAKPRRAQPSPLFGLLAATLVLLLLALTQKLFDLTTADFKAEKRKAVIMLNEPLVPKTKVLQAISLGYPQIAADLLWLQLIQYFGSGSPYGKYQALAPMLERITDLDPRFAYAYEFGLVVLPYNDAIDTAIKLGEKAQRELPENGLLTYYHAANLHIYKKDYRQASYYYDKAAGLPGAPGAAKNLAAVTKSKVDNSLLDRQAAIYYWQVIAEQAKSEEQRQTALAWAEHMTIVYTIEKQALAYQQATGRFPTNLEEMISAGYLPGWPESPVGREFSYHPETGKVSFEKLKP